MKAYGWFSQQWEEAKGTLGYHIEGLDLALGERILEILETKGITKEELAGRLDITTSTLSRWIDEPSKLTVQKLLKLSQALGSRLDVLIHEG